jgi:RimJ/RimL family protein N-acetyltransferase
MGMSHTKAEIIIRPALPEDAEMVFEWRNDPYIVARASSQRTIRRDEHIAWFEETMKSDQRKMFIVQMGSKPIGNVRFDRIDEDNCFISAYLLEQFTGGGYGVEAIKQGYTEIFKEWDVQKIVSCVRSDNLNGRSGFIKAGFSEYRHADFCSEAHFTLVLHRSDCNLKTSETEK